MVIDKNLGNRLKILIEEQQLTQKQLAEIIKIPVSTVNGYFQNSRQPDFETLDILASYFNVTTDYLIGRSPYRNAELSRNQLELIRLYDILSSDQQDLLIEQAKLYIRHNSKKEKQTLSDTILKNEA